MQELNSAALSDWYLARLRQQANKRSETKLTPRSLVETDISIVKVMVGLASVRRETRAAQILKKLEQDNRGVRILQDSIVWIAIAGSMLISFLLFR